MRRRLCLLFIALLAALLGSEAPAQRASSDSSLLTVDRIFGSPEFRGGSLGPLAWLSDGVGYTTLELSLNLVRGITVAKGPVLCTGRAIHVGRRTATAEGRIVAERTGKLLAHGTTTCLVTDLGS